MSFPVSSPLNILLVGSGGREHALAVALAKSPRCQKLWIAPGNPGMEALGERVDIAVTDCAALVTFATTHEIDLVVIGPEAPLAAGLVDHLKHAGILAFGPNQAGAQLEASKAFAKQMMDKAAVPTAKHVFCKNETEAREALSQFQSPYVIKQDGLAAGKGVTIAATVAEAHAAIAEAFLHQMPIVIEDFLPGEELSVLAICDGERAMPLLPARDYKKVGDGDQGPNTGGMGSFCPVPGITPTVMDRVQREVLDPLMGTLKQSGIDYRGVLYAGLMLAPNGTPNVIEFNARFGDPETQSVLALLEEDLPTLLLAAALGDLSAYVATGFNLKAGQSAVTLVLASQGYPGDYPTGRDVHLPETLPDTVQIFHAGTKWGPQKTLQTAGGRVLNVTATGISTEQARADAYAIADQIRFEGKQLRSDIALQPIVPSPLGSVLA